MRLILPRTGLSDLATRSLRSTAHLPPVPSPGPSTFLARLHTSPRRHFPPPPPSRRRGPPPPPPKNPLEATDDDIPYQTVRLVSGPDNTLGPPVPISSILSTYDRSTHTLILKSIDPFIVVKLLDKSAERQKQRIWEAKVKLSRKVAVEDKEVQISWGAGIGDLKHKAAQARAILERGDRATLMFAPKSGGPGASTLSATGGVEVTQKRKQEVVAVFEEAVGDVGVRVRADEMRKGALVQYWGPEKKVREQRRAKVQEEEVNKKKEKDDRSGKKERRAKEEERMRRKQEADRIKLERDRALAQGL